jgi:hypothetical protein
LYFISGDREGEEGYGTGWAGTISSSSRVFLERVKAIHMQRQGLAGSCRSTISGVGFDLWGGLIESVAIAATIEGNGPIYCMNYCAHKLIIWLSIAMVFLKFNITLNCLKIFCLSWIMFKYMNIWTMS